MLASPAPSELASRPHGSVSAATDSAVPENAAPADDVDDFAAARGLLLGAALGAVCLGVLVAAVWWLL
jgi:hypothetical protein